jgi:hypothetical protein
MQVQMQMRCISSYEGTRDDLRSRCTDPFSAVGPSLRFAVLPRLEDGRRMEGYNLRGKANLTCEKKAVQGHLPKHQCRSPKLKSQFAIMPFSPSGERNASTP